MHVLVACCVLADSIVGTLAGFGTSVFLVPILLLKYPLHATLILVSALHLLNNTQRTLIFFSNIHWPTVIYFGFPAILASILGAHLTFFVSAVTIERVLAVFILTYVIITIFFTIPPIKATRGVYGISGTLYGFVEGLTGVGGPLRTMVLSYDSRFIATSFVATTSIIALLVDIARLGTYTVCAMPTTFTLWDYLVCLILTFIGSMTGHLVLQHLPVTYFRYIVLIALTATAIKLLIAP